MNLHFPHPSPGCPSPTKTRRPSGWPSTCRLLAVVGLAFGAVLPAEAGLPEPGVRLFGTVALDGVLVTAARTSVVVEARRSRNGPAFASYRMGSRSGAGNFYMLKLDAEGAAPSGTVGFVPLGSTVHLVVSDETGERAAKEFTLSGRGLTARLDFGSPDSDGDGMSDEFETLYFGSATGGNPTADPDGDGRPNRREALDGTDPLVRDGRHPADIGPADWNIDIQEATEYALAWKLGQPWSVEPFTIPLDYVTRSSALWVGGEYYRFDSDPGKSAPLWWVNAPRPPSLHAPGPSAVAEAPDETEKGQMRQALLASARVVAEARNTSGGAANSRTLQGASVPRAERDLPAEFELHRAFTVTVQVAPGAGTRAFAVEEAPPAGWPVRFIDGEGRWDAKSGKIRWGPFYGSEPRVLHYEVTPLSAAATASFVGAMSSDGSGSAISGDAVPGVSGLSSAPLIQIVASPGRTGIVFRFQGQVGRSYQVEATTDWRTWTAVESTRVGPDGYGAFEAPADATARFFRVRE